MDLGFAANEGDGDWGDEDALEQDSQSMDRASAMAAGKAAAPFSATVVEPAKPADSSSEGRMEALVPAAAPLVPAASETPVDAPPDVPPVQRAPSLVPGAPPSRIHGDPHTRYFVIKSNNHKNLVLSIENNVWATQRHNEDKLNEALRTSPHVILVFSVNCSGCFQGYAKMLGPVGASRKSVFPGYGRHFDVRWIRLDDLDFSEVSHISNPWNENKSIKISRDGQELPFSVGQQICQMVDLHVFRSDLEGWVSDEREEATGGFDGPSPPQYQAAAPTQVPAAERNPPPMISAAAPAGSMATTHCGTAPVPPAREMPQSCGYPQVMGGPGFGQPLQPMGPGWPGHPGPAAWAQHHYGPPPQWPQFHQSLQWPGDDGSSSYYSYSDSEEEAQLAVAGGHMSLGNDRAKVKDKRRIKEGKLKEAKHGLKHEKAKDRSKKKAKEPKESKHTAKGDKAKKAGKEAKEKKRKRSKDEAEVKQRRTEGGRKRSRDRRRDRRGPVPPHEYHGGLGHRGWGPGYSHPMHVGPAGWRGPPRY